ncbi:AUR protein kinase [Saprolegnia diclina VS20]|uniref:AUR protein kinase n=1 Tax=Saprolegnia diclina (strain VS20) TaxID=1156394 RepID=T0QT33_SAPDV|nr:AUR protein kinase [Saprolegnia diclina VS20]EQC37165.1 AUR protein kinase [Saprolegnia diclina VS20]|eukprot:XP_008609327.1 AUR protein kinase [Saprolegnia diclina VS20]
MSSKTTDVMDGAVAMMDENSSPNPKGNDKKRAAPQSKPSPSDGKRARTDASDPTIMKSEFMAYQAMDSAALHQCDAADLKAVAKRLKLGYKPNKKSCVEAILNYYRFITVGSKCAPPFLPEINAQDEDLRAEAVAISAPEAAQETLKDDEGESKLNISYDTDDMNALEREAHMRSLEVVAGLNDSVANESSESESIDSESIEGESSNDEACYDIDDTVFPYGSASWDNKVREQGTLSRERAHEVFGAPADVVFDRFPNLPNARVSGDWPSGFSTLVSTTTFEDFRFVKDLDCGKSCVVRAAVHVPSNTIVAVKAIPLDALKDVRQAINFRREGESQIRIRCAHIVAAYNWFTHKGRVYIVQELCAKGNLLNALLQSNGAFSTFRVASIIRQLVRGLTSIHGKGVLHRHLRVENILLDHNDVVKITDFGFSACNTKGGRLSNDNRNLYSAPEKLEGKPHWTSVDLWGLGIVLYTLLMDGHGPPRYDATNAPTPSKVDYVILPVEIPATMSENAAHLVRNLLVEKEEERFTLSDVEMHPFTTTGV